MRVTPGTTHQIKEALRHHYEQTPPIDTYDSSDGLTTYFIHESGDGSYYCTCRGWIASKSRPRSCKHLVDFIRKWNSGRI